MRNIYFHQILEYHLDMVHIFATINCILDSLDTADMILMLYQNSLEGSSGCIQLVLQMVDLQDIHIPYFKHHKFFRLYRNDKYVFNYRKFGYKDKAYNENHRNTDDEKDSIHIYDYLYCIFAVWDSSYITYPQNPNTSDVSI